jgi:hypothetical protein
MYNRVVRQHRDNTATQALVTRAAHPFFANNDVTVSSRASFSCIERTSRVGSATFP